MKARYIGAHGGRGSGKSHYFGERWLRESIAEPLDFVCLRETSKSLEFSVRKLLVSKISHYNAGAYFEVQDRRILSKNGGVTIFEGMQNHTADSIKSLEGSIARGLPRSQAASDKSLTLLRPTIRGKPGKPKSQLWFDWNPENATDPIDVLLRGDVKPPDSAVVEVNYMQNPWLPDDLRGNGVRQEARPGQIRVGVAGEVPQAVRGTQVFKNWRVEEFDVSPGGRCGRARIGDSASIQTC